MESTCKRLLTSSQESRPVARSRGRLLAKTPVLSIVLCLALGWVAVAFVAVENLAAQTPQALKLEGDVEYTHDPSIAKDGDTWYLFGTANGPNRKGELPIRCSQDLHHWRLCGSVFEKIPDWITQQSPATKELWAPDISYFDGEFHLYYAFSVFGKNTSGIALLTNKTLNPSSPDFHWVDHGLVLRSRAEDDFNAIDPNLVIDEKGQPWLAFGSFWSGIKMRQIDRKTGLLSATDTKLYSLASRKRPENPPAESARSARRLASRGGALHHSSWRLFLFVCFLGSVLPRNEEQLQNHGWTISQRYRPLRGREWHADARRRRHSFAARQQPLDRSRWRVAPATKRRRHHRLSRLRWQNRARLPSDFDSRVGEGMAQGGVGRRQSRESVACSHRRDVRPRTRSDESLLHWRA